MSDLNKRDVSFLQQKRKSKNGVQKGFKTRTQVICCKVTNHVANDKCVDNCGGISSEDN